MRQIHLRMESGNMLKRQQPTKEQIPAEGHQLVFNAAGGWPQSAPG